MNKNIFVAILSYKRPLEEINEKREEHLTFINDYVLSGKFIAVGRQNPAIGGVIIAHNITRKEFETILINDPYYTNKLAEHTIVEFTPGMFAQGIEESLEKLK